MPHGDNKKLYVADFDHVSNVYKFIAGLQNAGFDIRKQDVDLFEPKNPERVRIRFQTRLVGKRVVNALNDFILDGFILDGKKVVANGARPADQSDTLDPRGTIHPDTLLNEADIRNCVVALYQDSMADAQSFAKDKKKAWELDEGEERMTKRVHKAEAQDSTQPSTDIKEDTEPTSAVKPAPTDAGRSSFNLINEDFGETTTPATTGTPPM